VGAGTGNSLAAGGIAGVAVPDKVTGAAIKTVNDQHKYALWEFYYDPTQDTLKAPMGAPAQPAGNNGSSNSAGLGANSSASSNSSTQISSATNTSTDPANGGGTASSTTTQSPPQ
jgi:hypothetical protein